MMAILIEVACLLLWCKVHWQLSWMHCLGQLAVINMTPSCHGAVKNLEGILAGRPFPTSHLH